MINKHTEQGLNEHKILSTTWCTLLSIVCYLTESIKDLANKGTNSKN